MSPLRKLKTKLRLYKIWRTNSIKRDNFYCFILDRKEVKASVEKYGFELVLKYSFDATKELKDEVFWLKPVLQKVYDSQMIIAKGMRFLNSVLFSKITGHITLLVFRKF